MATANTGWIVLPGSARAPALLPEKRVGTPYRMLQQEAAAQVSLVTSTSTTPELPPGHACLVLLPEKRVGSPSMVVHQGDLMGESAALVSGTLPPKSVLPASTASLSVCRSIHTILYRVSKKGHFIKMYVATL